MCHELCNNEISKHSMKNPNPLRAFQRVTYIYGQVAQQMSKDDLIEALSLVEHHIEALRKLNTTNESTTLDDKIATLEKYKASIVKYMDARTY